MLKKCLAITAALVATVAGTQSAAASAVAPHDSNQDFAAQGRAADLSTDQIEFLQAEADRYLAEHGGEQVALNRVELDGATIRIALPNEPHPRNLSSEASSKQHHCNYKRFCAYSERNYYGTEIEMYRCGVYNIPWTSTGSWYNNQQGGARAEMLNEHGQVTFRTGGRGAHDRSGSWANVAAVRNC
ncbi:hypothetical protein [Actinopolyspora mortivallis]|uniref:hypothetical protein n=1 Tax=Actinopolyspora mortivallis TaxID=33906 RepID=UPI00035CC706|nr:hypothetical protein [Actinopolyspora mortivallis]